MPIRTLREVETLYGAFPARAIVTGLTALQEQQLIDGCDAERVSAVLVSDSVVICVNQRSSVLPSILTSAGDSLVLAVVAPVITGGTVGSAFAAQLVASGGSAPYTFAVIAGSLPAGLSLNASTGTITGTPTTAGTSSGITVRVTDALGATATASAFSITVAAAGAALVISGTPATTGTVGTAYSASVTASGGTGPYTYALAAGSLPAGLSLNASTGAISGTPTTAGTSSGITVRVTDAIGATANASAFSITIAAAALDTRPRYFVAPANAYTTGTQGYLNGATPLTGSANGGAAGTFSLTTSSGNYGWLAVLASASTAGVRVFDGVGYGGWSGAGLAGNNTGASPDPSTSGTTFTDSAGIAWRLFRQDYVNANPTAGSYTLSAA